MATEKQIAKWTAKYDAMGVADHDELMDMYERLKSACTRASNTLEHNQYVARMEARKEKRELSSDHPAMVAVRKAEAKRDSAWTHFWIVFKRICVVQDQMSANRKVSGK
jgi:hypothetical protein